jgi:hypothetical protein
VVGVRQLVSRPDLPFDARFGPSRDSEHAVVGIESGHVALGSDASVRGASEHARAAPHVEHPVARADVSNIQNVGGPLLEQGGHEERVVDLGCSC